MTAFERDFVLLNGRAVNFKSASVPKLNDFFMCIHQVTQSEFFDVMGYNSSSFKGADHPVEMVSWYEAVQYCNKLSELNDLDLCYQMDGDNVSCDFDSSGYRLPTEAEWMFAVNGGSLEDSFIFSGSDDIADVGWCYDGVFYGTRGIMLKKPNSFGIYDMTGNVWEWCWDWYKTKGECADESEYYMTMKKVSKGGSWGDYPDGCTNDYRGIGDPKSRNPATGFRVVRTRKLENK